LPSPRDIIRILTNTIVDVVGINKEDRGRHCEIHRCCGPQVLVTKKVKIVKERMVYRNEGGRG
jgi:hypothetical protein